MGKNQQQYLGDLKKRQSLNFKKKKKNIPLSIFKMQAMNEKKKRKTKRGLKMKKKSYVLGTTMFKKKQKNSTYRATTPQASLNIYETLVLKRSKKTHRNYLKN